MRIVLISDTHGFEPEVPEGDILIHAGDLTMSGIHQQVAAAGAWLQMLPHKYKVVIAGNHDWLFQRDLKTALDRLGDLDKGIIYLENAYEIVNGLKIYGSPVQPTFFNWAFNIDRGEPIRNYWNMIPNDVDILITHGPPMGILDQANERLNTEHCGCEELLLAIKRVKPRVHVFGHIHGGYGNVQLGETAYYNASVVNEAYEVTNKPWVIDL